MRFVVGTSDPGRMHGSAAVGAAREGASRLRRVMVQGPPAPPLPGWGDATRVVAVQAGLSGTAIAAMAATPAGLALALPAVAAAAVAGGWWWAVRVGRGRGQLETASVRRLAARVGALAAPPLGLAYATVASLPGQVDLPAAGVAAVACALGVAGGASAAGLAACGVDLGRGYVEKSGAGPQR